MLHRDPCNLAEFLPCCAVFSIRISEVSPIHVSSSSKLTPWYEVYQALPGCSNGTKNAEQLLGELAWYSYLIFWNLFEYGLNYYTLDHLTERHRLYSRLDRPWKRVTEFLTCSGVMRLHISGLCYGTLMERRRVPPLSEQLVSGMYFTTKAIKHPRI